MKIERLRLIFSWPIYSAKDWGRRVLSKLSSSGLASGAVIGGIGSSGSGVWEMSIEVKNGFDKGKYPDILSVAYHGSIPLQNKGGREGNIGGNV